MFMFIKDLKNLQSSLSGKNWMKGVGNHRRITQLSIPGTHDTMTYSLPDNYMNPSDAIGLIFAKCQALTLSKQLDMGVRFVDIRIDLMLKTRHTDFLCTVGLEDVFLILDTFLRNNPSETVFMRVKMEGGDGEINDFNNKINDLIKRYVHILWKRDNNNMPPTLGDVRGKVIVLDELRTHGADRNFFNQNVGFKYGDFGSTNPKFRFNVQDNYNGPLIEEKYKNITSVMNSTHRNRSHNSLEQSELIINHVSAAPGKKAIMDYALSDIKDIFLYAAGGLLGVLAKLVIDRPEVITPYQYATTLNPRIDAYLRQNPEHATGILVFDFIEEKYAEAVYKRNYTLTDAGFDLIQTFPEKECIIHSSLDFNKVWEVSGDKLVLGQWDIKNRNQYFSCKTYLKYANTFMNNGKTVVVNEADNKLYMSGKRDLACNVYRDSGGGIVFYSAHHGMSAIDVPWGNPAVGTQLQMYEYNGTDSQRFLLLTPDQSLALMGGDTTTLGRYKICNVKKGYYIIKCAGDKSFGIVNHVGIIMIKPGEPRGWQTITLRASKNPYFLHVSDHKAIFSGVHEETREPDVFNDTRNDGVYSPYWILYKGDDDTYIIQNRDTKKVLGVPDDHFADGQRIKMQNFNDSLGQRFVLEPIG
jgi:hypothetical protein